MKKLLGCRRELLAPLTFSPLTRHRPPNQSLGCRARRQELLVIPPTVCPRSNHRLLLLHQFLPQLPEGLSGWLC